MTFFWSCEKLTINLEGGAVYQYVCCYPFTVQLKLILNHQESRTLENHNMFKFRALLGETCLHKKGKQQTYFKCTAQYVWECCPNIANWNKTNDTILKKCLQAPILVEFSGQNASALEIWNNMKKYVEDQQSSIFVNIAPNNLNWTGL
jgi:hypothetical protein